MFELYPLIVIDCPSLSACCCGRVFTAITKSHPQRNELFRSDLDKCLPNTQDIQCAFVKVRQTCVIGEPHYTSSEWKWNGFLHLLVFAFHSCTSVWMFGLCADPFEESEERWFSSVENSRWLEYVRYVNSLTLPGNNQWHRTIFLTVLLS